MSSGYTINTSYLPPHIMTSSNMRLPGFKISSGKYVALRDIIKRTNPDSSEQIGYIKSVSNSDGSDRDLFVEFKPTNEFLIDIGPAVNANWIAKQAAKNAAKNAKRAAARAAPSLLNKCKNGVLAACALFGMGGRRTVKRATRTKRDKRATRDKRRS